VVSPNSQLSEGAWLPQAAHNRATTFRHDPANDPDWSAHAVGRPCGLRDVADTADVSVGCARYLQELTQASASKPELISKDYFANCMIALGAGAQAGQTKAP
jgi:hypothetical protein